jgi:glycosyltransferase involved in cell wall biosynthesis
MIRVLLVPSSDYVGHPFPQRHNQIFERLNDGENFEVHVVEFRLFKESMLKTGLIMHELGSRRATNLASYYFVNAVNHAAQIRKIVRQESIDVIVFSNLAAPFAFILMEKLSSLHVPIVFDLPDYYPTSAAGYMFDVKSVFGNLFTQVFNTSLRYIMRHATLVTTASSALTGYAKEAGARAVVQIPNGISENFLKLHDGKDLRDKLDYDQEDVVVGYVGSVEFWLDMRSLLRGLALARKKKLPVKLLIIGRSLQTSYSERVAGWIRQENLENCTRWLDFVQHEQVPEYMAGLDVGTIPFDVLNPTAYYAAPNKMWEYLSQQKPVICTPIPEALSNSDYVTPVLTPKDYARKLLLLTERDNSIFQKTKKGYGKALSMTWEMSAKTLASTLVAAVDRRKVGVR